MPDVLIAIERNLQEAFKSSHRQAQDEIALEDEVDEVNQQLDKTLDAVYENQYIETVNNAPDEIADGVRNLYHKIYYFAKLQDMFRLPHAIEVGLHTIQDKIAELRPFVWKTADDGNRNNKAVRDFFYNTRWSKLIETDITQPERFRNDARHLRKKKRATPHPQKQPPKTH